MSKKYVIDTHAWVEYFAGSKLGAKVDKILKSNNCLTPAIVITELAYKLMKEHADVSKAIAFIETRTDVIDISKDIAVQAGIINFRRKKKNKHWSLADSVVLATAESFKAIVVTGDADFKDLGDRVLFLREK